MPTHLPSVAPARRTVVCEPTTSHDEGPVIGFHESWSATNEKVVVIEPTRVHDTNTAGTEIIMKGPMLHPLFIIKGTVLTREFPVERTMFTFAEETTVVSPTVEIA